MPGYSLQVPFNPFVKMVLNHFQRALPYYTNHFYLDLGILEDINNDVNYGPLSTKHTLGFFYVKLNGVRYMLFKLILRDILSFPNKMKYEKTPAYEVGEKYTSSVQTRGYIIPNFSANFTFIMFSYF